MLSGDGNENGQNKISYKANWEKNTFAGCGTISFFVHFFVVVLHDYNVKLPETS